MSALRRTWSRLRGERGYSLIELLATMSILGVVLGGLTTIFVSGSKAELDMNRRFQAEQSARMAMARLRTELHAQCAASTASVTINGVAIGDLLLTPVGTVAGSCAAAPTIAWCFATSTAYTGRLALYEVTGSTCPADPTTGIQRADGIVASTALAPVTYFAAVTGGAGQHDSVSIDIPVKATPISITTGGKYELTDQIVMRNSPRH